MKDFLGYKIVRQLGEGGMGTVYLATSADGMRYALKTVKPDIADNDEFRQRFLREGRIAVRMKHDRVVGTFEAGESPDGILYMLTEFCPNGDVDHWIEKHPKTPLQIALQWTYDTALALEYIDSNRIIHRDLKPQNMLLDTGFRVKLGDVGCARGTSADATRLTEDGRIQGTPYYLSPEQSTGTDDLDIRSDLYALGVTLYQMLAGTVVFTGNTIAQILIKHMREMPEPITRHCPDLPPDIVALVHSLLEKDRNNRPANARILADAIRSTAAALSILIYDSQIPETEFRRLSGESAATKQATGLLADTLNAALGETLKYDRDGDGLSDTIGADSTPFDEEAIAATLKYDDDAFSDTQTAPGIPNAVLAPNFTAPVEIGRIDNDAKQPDLTEPADAICKTRIDTPSVQENGIDFLATRSPQWPSGKAWLTINLPSGAICDIALYLTTPVRFGRKRNEEVDYTARLYPTESNKDSIMRISNNHGRFDIDGQAWVIRDDGSRTGILVNSQPVEFKNSALLGDNADVVIAGVLKLRTAFVRSSIDGQPDGLTIYRTENKPSLLAAIILRRMTIGSTRLDDGLLLPDYAGPAPGAFLWRDKRLWWMPSEPTAFPGVGTVLPNQAVALSPGAMWAASGLMFGLRAFNYDIFQ
ncbi:MAG: FHA domain-containing serine/threonine-protein kinase [Planctomycetota bacterium]